MNYNNTGSKVGKAIPATKPQEKFFQQFIQLPPAIQGGAWQIIGIEQSGISPRDYFAAHALATATNTLLFDNSRSIAEWAYRVADAMLAARATVDESNNPPKELDNGSQFHGDYLKPHGNK